MSVNCKTANTFHFFINHKRAQVYNMSLINPNLPTASSIMQPYGGACVYSSEQDIAAKSARGSAPIALEINQDGVLQSNSLATRGQTHFGGPTLYTRYLAATPVAPNAGSSQITLTAAQLVNGSILICEGSAAFTITLPSVTELNSYLNEQLVTQQPAFDTAVTSTAPRTQFSFRIWSNNAVGIQFPTPAPPGHTTSGYSYFTFTTAADAIIVNAAAGSTRANFLTAPTLVTINKRYTELIFIQSLGASSTDPEWIILYSNN